MAMQRLNGVQSIGHRLAAGAHDMRAHLMEERRGVGKPDLIQKSKTMLLKMEKKNRH